MGRSQAALFYTYDTQNRLTGVLLPGSTLSYSYDSDGRRIQQIVDGTETNYVWDELSTYGNVVVETDVTQTVQVSYVLGAGQILSQTDSAGTAYLLPNVQGSTRLLTDVSATITDTYSYDTFGALLTHIGTSSNSYLYTGQQYNAESGLYNLRARSYDPTIGRFLSADTYPINYQNPAEFNRYVYTANNPVNFSDPSGYDSSETGSLYSSLMSGARSQVKRIGAMWGKLPAPLRDGFVAGGLGYFLGTLVYSAWSGTAFVKNFCIGTLIQEGIRGMFLSGINYAAQSLKSPINPTDYDRYTKLSYTVQGVWDELATAPLSAIMYFAGGSLVSDLTDKILTLNIQDTFHITQKGFETGLYNAISTVMADVVGQVILARKFDKSEASIEKGKRVARFAGVAITVGANTVQTFIQRAEQG